MPHVRNSVLAVVREVTLTVEVVVTCACRGSQSAWEDLQSRAKVDLGTRCTLGRNGVVFRLPFSNHWDGPQLCKGNDWFLSRKPGNQSWGPAGGVAGERRMQDY